MGGLIGADWQEIEDELNRQYNDAVAKIVAGPDSAYATLARMMNAPGGEDLFLPSHADASDPGNGLSGFYGAPPGFGNQPPASAMDFNFPEQQAAFDPVGGGQAFDWGANNVVPQLSYGILGPLPDLGGGTQTFPAGGTNVFSGAMPGPDASLAHAGADAHLPALMNDQDEDTLLDQHTDDSGSNPIGNGVGIAEASVSGDGNMRPVAMKNSWDDPANRQQEIDDAMRAYHIDSHGWAVRYYPNLNLRTDDPGVTDSGTGVQIGPNAFTGSYGNFVSTLIHEGGAHATQLSNGTLSGSGPGKDMNEVEAYDAELKNAKRTHLTDDEIGGILSNRNYYFNRLDPENQARVNKGIYTPHK